MTPTTNSSAPAITASTKMSKKADMASLPADPARELGVRVSRLVADALPLPPAFRAWFAGRGWELRAHQPALLQKAAERRSTLLIAPTGAGKTLAGFLPSLVALSRRRAARRGPAHPHPLHLAAQGAGGRRRAQPAGPVREMGLPDPRRDAHRRHLRLAQGAPAQRARPTSCSPRPSRWRCCCRTPMRRASSPGRCRPSSSMSCTRWRPPSAATSWRWTSPGSPRWRRAIVRIGLSATVARPSELRAYLVPQPGDGTTALADLVVADGRRAARDPHPRDRAAAALGRPHHPLRRPPRSTPPSRRTSCRWCSSTRAARPS